MMLPHGYEGMGPEHSSARLERFLQLSGNYNWQVCNATTPAQLFHVLRRQMKRDFQKPLILLTPKSLLRHPRCVSNTTAFTELGFAEILLDDVKPARAVKRMLLCSGKIYYDLLEKRQPGIPILRLEQLYPFPFVAIKAAMAKYTQLQELVWVQEEPANMGAWAFVQPRLPKPAGASLHYVGRALAGSTAEGSAKAHNQEQMRIVTEAFEGHSFQDPFLE
jgi:2-oxoglutarate dehydrogenase E1 component